MTKQPHPIDLFTAGYRTPDPNSPAERAAAEAGLDAGAVLAALRATGNVDAEDALIERVAGARLPPPGTGYVRCIFDHPPIEGSGAV